MPIIRTAVAADATRLAALAAETFPLACPPGISDVDIQTFIDTQLGVEHFGKHLSSDTTEILVVERDGQLVGYTLLDLTPPPATIGALIGPGRAFEIGKFFFVATEHGTGAATELMQAVVLRAERAGAERLWLGVSRENDRANRFYDKHGFHLVGTKSFAVGGHALPEDHVRSRDLN